MVQTLHTGITLVEQAQAQKEVTVNEAFTRIDALLNTGAVAWGWDIPPTSPQAGDVYIVGNNPTGAWEGFARHIAYVDQEWQFIAPQEGSVFWVNDENALLVYRFGFWRRASYSPLAAHSRRLMIQAAEMRPALSNGCAPLTSISLGSGKPELQHLAFDATIVEYAWAQLTMPDGWNGGALQLQFQWSHNNGSGGDVVFGAEAFIASDGVLLDASLSGMVTLTDTLTAANTLRFSALSADIIAAGASNGITQLYLRISRQTNDAGDTLNADARLHGLVLHVVQEGI